MTHQAVNAHICIFGLLHSWCLMLTMSIVFYRCSKKGGQSLEAEVGEMFRALFSLVVVIVRIIKDPSVQAALSQWCFNQGIGGVCPALQPYHSKTYRPI